MVMLRRHPKALVVGWLVLLSSSSSGSLLDFNVIGIGGSLFGI